MTLSREAQSLGLCLFKNSSNGIYCLCKELKEFNIAENPLGLKVVFISHRLKAIKGFLKDLRVKEERKATALFIKEGVEKRAEYLESLKLCKKLKAVNNEPSLFDFVS